MTDADNSRWLEAWSAALDDLELTLDQTQQLLQGEVPEVPAAPWVPPALPGSLPVQLAGRAQSLFARQQEMIREATEVAAGAKQQLSLLGKLNELSEARTPERSIYVDVSA